MLKSILLSDIRIKHFLVVNAVAMLLTLVVMQCALFVCWGFTGDGPYPHSWDPWLETGVLLSPVVVLYPILLFRMIVHCRKGRFSYAKSFLVGLLVVALTDYLLAFHYGVIR